MKAHIFVLGACFVLAGCGDEIHDWGFVTHALFGPDDSKQAAQKNTDLHGNRTGQDNAAPGGTESAVRNQTPASQNHAADTWCQSVAKGDEKQTERDGFDADTQHLTYETSLRQCLELSGNIAQ